MEKIVWEKMVTREGNLLDRYLEMTAYTQLIKKFSKTSVANVFTVSKKNISTLYLNQADLVKNRKIAWQEFKQGKSKLLFKFYLRIFNQSLNFIQRIEKLPENPPPFLFYKLFNDFCNYYALNRAIVFYNHIICGLYFEEKLSKLLAKGNHNQKMLKNYLITPTISPKIYKKFAKIYSISPHLIKQKNKILEKEKFSFEEKELIEQIGHNEYFFEVAERISNKIFKVSEKLLTLITQDKKIDSNDLLWYLPKEIGSLFKNGELVASEKIKKRKSFYVFLKKNNKFKLLVGKRAKRIISQNLISEKTSKLKSINGTIASPGFTKGRVAIIRTINEIKKMDHAEIFVSTMTSPKLYGAAQKAKVIVTDEGGIICHAAIIAREFGIPCIIGTKIATQVLKDGDLVEVDAKKGVVKIIKRK